MKQLKLLFLLCFITISTFAQTAQRGEQDPPIPGVGIVIKRNPGGGASKMVVTNEKGEATIKINEAGNYTLALSQTQGKSAGEPLVGIIVKCGKNPGGSQFQVTTNEKGEAELKGLERGEYNLQVFDKAINDDKATLPGANKTDNIRNARTSERLRHKNKIEGVSKDKKD